MWRCHSGTGRVPSVGCILVHVFDVAKALHSCCGEESRAIVPWPWSRCVCSRCPRGLHTTVASNSCNAAVGGTVMIVNAFQMTFVQYGIMCLICAYWAIHALEGLLSVAPSRDYHGRVAFERTNWAARARLIQGSRWVSVSMTSDLAKLRSWSWGPAHRKRRPSSTFQQCCSSKWRARTRPASGHATSSALFCALL